MRIEALATLGCGGTGRVPERRGEPAARPLHGLLTGPQIPLDLLSDIDRPALLLRSRRHGPRQRPMIHDGLHVQRRGRVHRIGRGHLLVDVIPALEPPGQVRCGDRRAIDQHQRNRGRTRREHAPDAQIIAQNEVELPDRQNRRHRGVSQRHILERVHLELHRHDDIEVDDREDWLPELYPQTEQEVLADHTDAGWSKPNGEDHQR